MNFPQHFSVIRKEKPIRSNEKKNEHTQTKEKKQQRKSLK